MTSEIDFIEIVAPEGVPRIFVIPADCVPQLDAPWVIVQPETFRKGPTQGWHPVREQCFLGSAEVPRIPFRREDPETLCGLKVDAEGTLTIQNMSDKPLRLIARYR